MCVGCGCAHSLSGALNNLFVFVAKMTPEKKFILISIRKANFSQKAFKKYYSVIKSLICNEQTMIYHYL